MCYLVANGWAGLISGTLRDWSQSTTGTVARLLRVWNGFRMPRFMAFVVLVMVFVVFNGLIFIALFNDLMWICGWIFILIIFKVFLFVQLRARILYWCYDFRMSACLANICCEQQNIKCGRKKNYNSTNMKCEMFIGEIFMSWKHLPKHKYKTITAVTTFIFISFRWWWSRSTLEFTLSSDTFKPTGSYFWSKSREFT